MSLINPMQLTNPFKTFSTRIFVVLLLEVACGIFLILGSIAGVGIFGAFQHIAATYHAQIIESSGSSVAYDLEKILNNAVKNEKQLWEQQSPVANSLNQSKYELAAWHYKFSNRQLNIVSGESSKMMILSAAGMPFRQLLQPEADLLPAYPGDSLPILPKGLSWNINRVVVGEKAAWLLWAMSDGGESGIWGFRIWQDNLRSELVKLLRRHGQVLSRQQILGFAWGYDYDGTPRTVDNTVANLRRKLSDASIDQTAIISSHPGLGYSLKLLSSS